MTNEINDYEKGFNGPPRKKRKNPTELEASLDDIKDTLARIQRLKEDLRKEK